MKRCIHFVIVSEFSHCKWSSSGELLKTDLQQEDASLQFEIFHLCTFTSHKIKHKILKSSEN